MQHKELRGMEIAIEKHGLTASNICLIGSQEYNREKYL